VEHKAAQRRKKREYANAHDYKEKEKCRTKESTVPQKSVWRWRMKKKSLKSEGGGQKKKKKRQSARSQRANCQAKSGNFRLEVNPAVGKETARRMPGTYSIARELPI